MKNFIIIDIDSDRDKPIKIDKPTDMQPSIDGYDNMLKQDINDLVLTSLYLASMLDSDSEKEILSLISEKIIIRKNEVQ